MSVSERVSTKYGLLRGIRRNTESKLPYTAFFGVPYAKLPTAELRFRDPKPIEPWTDELDATRETSGAYQVSDTSPKSVIGSENCLILNIYTRSFVVQQPVYVWIHGGGFAFGSSTSALYRPDYFIEKDIVVVTMNYRLGALGFLSFKDESLGIPGNAGLKDQCMALRWIKENISCFGGDPNKVTLAGESAGAGAVHFHLISPLSEGLFQRAIIQSGAAFSPWASMPEGESYEYELAKFFGWNGEDGDRGAFETIASTDIEKLVLITPDFIKDPAKRLFGSAEYSPFLPRVEPYKSQMCFLPKSVLELGREAWSKDIDIIVGGNKDEGFLFERNYKAYAPLLEKDFKFVIPNALRQAMSEEEQELAARTLKELYFGEQDVNLKIPSKFYEIFGDIQYWHPMHRLLLQRQGTGRTYLYFLAATTDPQLKIFKMWRNLCNISHHHGCSHGDDLALLWKSIFSKKPAPGNQCYWNFVRFVGAYVNFIKKGSPDHPSLQVEWKPATRNDEGFTCMKFTDEKAECMPLPYWKRLQVWDSIYNKKM